VTNKLIKGENDFESWCKKNNRNDLLLLWSPKNVDALPSDFHYGSGKKVWWKCQNGHPDYEMPICKKSKRNFGCPYCSGQRVCIDNCLATTNPEVLEEWDYNKNQITPYEVSKGSEKIVWWKCNKGHSYDMSIHRKIRSGCPICSGQRVDKDNCLATINPTIASQWHPTKNGDLTPSMVTCGTHKKVWWICEKKHEWETPVYVRTKMNCGCPICDGEKRTSFPEQALLFYLSKLFLVESRVKVDKVEIDVYLPKIKVGIEYDGEFFHKGLDNEIREKKKNQKLLEKGITLIRIKETKKQIEFSLDKTYYGFEIKCHYEQSYEYMNKVISYVLDCISKLSNGKYSININVPKDKNTILGQYLINEKENSLAIKKPLASEKWDYEKNGEITPSMVSYSSKKRFYFKCKYCGNEWISAVENVSDSKYCPRCVHSNGNISTQKRRIKNMGTRTLSDSYSLATLYPNLLEEWDYEKNTINPFNVTPGSNKVAYWKCNVCGYEWNCVIKSRIKGHGCPKCGIDRARKAKFKKVLNIDTNEIYESVDEAAKINKINRICISNCCKQKQKSAGGYHWKYVDEEDES